MGRLVDIDEVIRIAENTFPQEDVRKIMWVLCHTPTAYNVEKVVAELIQFGLNSMDKQIYDSDTYYDGVSVAIRKACNIVKRGGVE